MPRRLRRGRRRGVCPAPRMTLCIVSWAAGGAYWIFVPLGIRSVMVCSAMVQRDALFRFTSLINISTDDQCHVRSHVPLSHGPPSKVHNPRNHPDDFDLFGAVPSQTHNTQTCRSARSSPRRLVSPRPHPLCAGASSRPPPALRPARRPQRAPLAELTRVSSPASTGSLAPARSSGWMSGRLGFGAGYRRRCGVSSFERRGSAVSGGVAGRRRPARSLCSFRGRRTPANTPAPANPRLAPIRLKWDNDRFDVAELLAFSAREPSLSLAFNYASLLVNNSYFLEGLVSSTRAERVCEARGHVSVSLCLLRASTRSCPP